MHHSVVVWTNEEDLQEAVKSVEDWLGQVGDENNWFTVYEAVNSADQVWAAAGLDSTAVEPAPTFAGSLQRAVACQATALAFVGAGKLAFAGGGFRAEEPEALDTFEKAWAAACERLKEAVETLPEIPAPGDSPIIPGDSLSSPSMLLHRIRRLLEATEGLHDGWTAELPFPFVDADSLRDGCLYMPFCAFALLDWDTPWKGERRGTLVWADVHT